MAPVWIAGAGFTGAVIARILADAGYEVTVMDIRDHVAGNCHTERDPVTGVLVHKYGPHIFHTADTEVWDFVNSFGTFEPFEHRVWSTVGDDVFAMPINLKTINQFFGTDMTEEQARDFVSKRAHQIENPANFEEQALAMIGPELYEAFFKGYTMKQWGRLPTELPASILKRLPLRFNDDTRYFNHPFQGMPRDGYTPIVQGILDHPNIRVELNRAIDPDEVPADTHLFWTGPLDSYFRKAMGDLGYRTLDFEHETFEGTYQSCPVMNYGDPDVPFTRKTEHKHFAPWETHDNTIVTTEFSRECTEEDVPFYPIRLTTEKVALRRYVDAARATAGVTFAGRLGTYRYLDMDVAIREAMDCAKAYLTAVRTGVQPPIFSVDPLS